MALLLKTRDNIITQRPTGTAYGMQMTGAESDLPKLHVKMMQTSKMMTKFLAIL